MFRFLWMLGFLWMFGFLWMLRFLGMLRFFGMLRFLGMLRFVVSLRVSLRRRRLGMLLGRLWWEKLWTANTVEPTVAYLQERRQNPDMSD